MSNSTNLRKIEKPLFLLLLLCLFPLGISAQSLVKVANRLSAQPLKCWAQTTVP